MLHNFCFVPFFCYCYRCWDSLSKGNDCIEQKCEEIEMHKMKQQQQQKQNGKSNIWNTSINASLNTFHRRNTQECVYSIECIFDYSSDYFLHRRSRQTQIKINLSRVTNLALPFCLLLLSVLFTHLAMAYNASHSYTFLKHIHFLCDIFLPH